uniref:Uncharacterized protein n=1 Tax=Globodera rostochiensis TaxID=31243 RepID=A0A914HM37_GLORO
MSNINILYRNTSTHGGALYKSPSMSELGSALVKLQKMKHLYEKAVEQEIRARENKKLQDDLHETKAALADATRKLHELDLENARLAGEIRKPQTALKEAEEKEEEIENMRKNMHFEIAFRTSTFADPGGRDFVWAERRWMLFHQKHQFSCGSWATDGSLG